MSIFIDDVVKEVEVNGYKFGLKEISYGEMNQIQKKAMNFNLITKQPDIDLAILSEEKLKASLVYIKDKMDQEVPVSLDVVRKLKNQVANTLVEAIDSINEVQEEEKKI